MGLFDTWFPEKKKKLELVKEKAVIRRRLEDVKIDQNIEIEYASAKGRICTAKCLSNDPYTKKMLIQLRWNRGKDNPVEVEKVILEYDGYELANFHLLNPQIKTKDLVKKESLETKLKHDLEKAIESGDYEKAERLKIKLSEI